ncbi:MAG: GNAT family N-acetyltransferase, partial [Nocardioidaceae bacterium]
SAGLRFAHTLGFAEAITELMKVVDLKATEASWAGLAAEAAPHHAGYQLLTCHDVVPEELVAGYCVLNEAFVAEAPMGDLDVESERWDAQRVRDQEARNARTGRHVVATFALDADGTVVGATEVMVNENIRWRGMQSGTLVLPGHRGHRLGLAMKLANQAAVRERWPAVEVLFTGNAGVNAPMNAVNDRLGYAGFERCVEVQRSLEGRAR